MLIKFVKSSSVKGYPFHAYFGKIAAHWNNQVIHVYVNKKHAFSQPISSREDVKFALEDAIRVYGSMA